MTRLTHGCALRLPIPRNREEPAVVIPEELQAAVDAGEEEKVKQYLADEKAHPELANFSKSLKKKLLKDVQIAAKKIAKGGAPKPAAKPNSPPATGKPSAEAKPSAAPAAPAGSGVGAAGAIESRLVADFLAAIDTLSLSPETVAALKAKETAIAKAMQPAVNALRNEAYTAGFCAQK